MSSGFEQRNPYLGDPPRPWVRVRLEASDGTLAEVDLLADTGSPYALILGSGHMVRFQQAPAPGEPTNFGFLQGGWLLLTMPELGLVQMVLGYASDAVVIAVQASCPSFQGLAGLPFLRLVEYGGDANWFWLRFNGPQP